LAKVGNGSPCSAKGIKPLFVHNCNFAFLSRFIFFLPDDPSGPGAPRLVREHAQHVPGHPGCPDHGGGTAEEDTKW